MLQYRTVCESVLAGPTPFFTSYHGAFLGLAFQSIAVRDDLCTLGSHCAWEILSLIHATITHFACECETHNLCRLILYP